MIENEIFHEFRQLEEKIQSAVRLLKKNGYTVYKANDFKKKFK
jgi:hypothetical protein